MSIIRRALALLAALALLIPVLPARAEGGRPYFGVDVSELLAQEASGVKYHDAQGNEADALHVLAACGVTHIRVRVWNDPFDADGHGYGAGNINAAAAAVLSARAAACGMKTLVDFHYSDFWADPARQIAPKAWEGMSLDEKARALYDYTRQSLAAMLDAALTFFVWANGQRYETAFMNAGWEKWQYPTLDSIPVTRGNATIGVEIRCGAKSWGTLDDFSLIPLSQRARFISGS